MINLVGVERAIKKVYHLGLIVSLFFLLLYAGGCGGLSRSIVVSNLDDTVESFACHAAEGARRAGAKITEAELKINAGTAFDMEAGTLIPIALPVTAKAGTHIEEGTTLTIKLDLSNVKCEGAPPKVQTYKMNTETLKIQEKLKIK
jgi:hypothetical protein